MEGNWKADKVLYNGILFRSKLEAKVAILLDSMKVDWLYEPDAFELPGGLRYKPDFRVKCYGKRGSLDRDNPFDLYIEAKGVMSSVDAKKIASFGSCEPILVIGNFPKVENPGDYNDNYIMGSYNTLQNSGIYPFNYRYIDGDYFGAYPVTDGRGHFFLNGDDSNYTGEEDETATLNAYRRAYTAIFEDSGKTDIEGRKIYTYTHSGCDVTTVRKLSNGSFSREEANRKFFEKFSCRPF